MNCFQHPDRVAVVFCRECSHALCADCARQNIKGQTRACTEVCAQLASMRPPEPAPASFFDRVYASLFIVVLLAILGGMFVTWAAQSAMYRQKSIERGEYVRRDQRPREMVVFYFLGITDWRLQFAIGAGIGAASGLLYVRRNISRKRKPAQ